MSAILPNSAIFHSIIELTGDLTEEINKCKNSSDKTIIVKKHIESLYKLQDGKVSTGKKIVNITFDQNCEWVTPQPSLSTNSTLYVIEFFTHCCINCTHTMEDVRQIALKLEERRKSITKESFCNIQFIGIHSPKFSREKQTDSVQSFVFKNQVKHSSVISDPNSIIWNDFEIFCWPTVIICGPNLANKDGSFSPNLLFASVGEGIKEELSLFINTALDYFDEKLPSFPDHIKNDANLVQQIISTQDSVDGQGQESFKLSYPGKIEYFNDLLAISDSGNNRIVIANTDGVIKEIIGGKELGYKDGDFLSAKFYNPQGIVFRNEELLFVADTGNHAIREICLKTKNVSTLVNPNSPIGDDIILMSPWDLAFYGSTLLIAAAGNHQIFGYFFQNTLLFRTTHLKGSIDLIAGSGKEENRNNQYILKSSFAQPSGIAVSQCLNENDRVIYICDSESSTIRFIDSGGRVLSLCGGNKNPNDLFAFGDEDGCFYDVKLQHPMGVCSGVGATKIFIADTFNHKIKMIDVETKHCTTLIGKSRPGNQEIGSFSGYLSPLRRNFSSHPLSKEKQPAELALLNEPGGIAINDNLGHIYIADTNNNEIKLADLRKKTVSSFELRFANKLIDKEPDQVFKIEANLINECSIQVPAFELKIFNLPVDLEGCQWKVCPIDKNIILFHGSTEKREEDNFCSIKIKDFNLNTKDSSNEEAGFRLKIDVFYCGKNSCIKKTLRLVFQAIILKKDEDAKALSPFEFYPDQSLFTEH